MNIETILQQPFTDKVKIQLVEKAVISGLEVPKEHLKKALDFYESKEDYFVAADVAEALGDKEKRKLMLNHAASELIKTKAQKDAEFKKVMARIDAGDYFDSKKKYYHHRVDYEVIGEDGGIMGMSVMTRGGKFQTFGDMLGVKKTEGKSFDWCHAQAIKSVLRGDVDDAKSIYSELLDRATKASQSGNGFIKKHTLEPEKVASLALEVGDFDKAYEILDKRGMNHYAAVLAKIQGYFDKANELFDRQIERTISTKSQKGNIRGIKVGGHVNYFHAALVAEMKGDLSKRIEMLAADNKYQELIRLADKGKVDRKVVEPLIKKIRDTYIEESSGISLMDESIGKIEATKIWKQYGLSNLDLLSNALKTKGRMLADNTITYITKVTSKRLFEVALHTKIAADMTVWLGDKEEAIKLRKVAYTFSEKADSHLTSELAIELNDKKLIEDNLEKVTDREDESGKQGGRTYSSERRNLLVALGRFDEALEGTKGFDKRHVLKKAGRWEEICDLIEENKREDVDIGGGLRLDKRDAYKIATEHNLKDRKERIYGKLVDERKGKEDFAFYDMVQIIIDRNDKDLAKKVVDSAKEELFNLPELKSYALNRLEKLLPLAEYVNDKETGDLFTLIPKLGKVKSKTVQHKHDLEGKNRNTENEIKVIFGRAIARYEKYFKPLLDE